MRYRLDTSGLRCPLPVRLTARRVAQLRPGDELDVIGDDPVMGLDLEAWCFDTGHELLEQGGEPPDSGPIYWRIVVREHRGSRPEGMDGLQPDDDSEVGNARRDDDKT